MTAPLAEKPTHPAIPWVLVPLYVISSIVALGTAAMLALIMASAAFSERGLQGYCYHGGASEPAAYALFLGWPVVLLQIALSLAVGRAVSRRAKLIANFSLPAVVLLAALPCVAG